MGDFIFYFEVIAVLTGILSVWLTKKENMILYPVGICSVSIWIYLCWIGDLFGQSIINFFFLIMNIYGWCNWQSKDDNQKFKIQIKKNNHLKGLERSYNCHNQYLQELCYFGIFGLLYFICWLYYVFKASTHTNTIFQLLVFSILVYFCTESIMSVNKGIIFISYFFTLIAIYEK